MKLKLPLGLLAALLVCLNGVQAATPSTDNPRPTNPDLNTIEVAMDPVFATPENPYHVTITGATGNSSQHLSGVDVTWAQSYDYSDKVILNVGTALTPAKLSIITPEGAEEKTVVTTKTNLFIGCPGWGISTADWKPNTGEVYVGKDATLIVGNDQGADTSTSQLNVGAGGSHSQFGHEGILTVDGGTVKAGVVTAANGYYDLRGTINVKNGGTLTAVYGGGQTGVLTMGYYGESIGTLNVESGSTVTAEYYTAVGLGYGDAVTQYKPGYGYLKVSGESTANLGYLYVGWMNASQGVVSVDDSTVNAWSTYLAYSAGAQATMSLTNGTAADLGDTYIGHTGHGDIKADASSLTAGQVVIGYKEGSSGSLSITNGAKVNSSSQLVAGFNEGSHGDIVVSGQGSVLQPGMESNIYIGNYGTGTLTVSDGAQVFCLLGGVAALTEGSAIHVHDAEIVAGGGVSIQGGAELQVTGAGVVNASLSGVLIGSGSSLTMGSEAPIQGQLMLDGATLQLDGVNTSANVGSLTMGTTGTSTLMVDKMTGLSSGTYTLLTYNATGAATPENQGNLVIGGVAEGGLMEYALDYSNAGALKLTVSVTKTDEDVLVWKEETGKWTNGAEGSAWEAPAITTESGESGVSDFAASKKVIFEGGTAEVKGEVTPYSILVIGEENTTITSSAPDSDTTSPVANKITGENTGLTKDGTGTLTIDVVNEAGGKNIIRDGLVSVTNENGLGKGEYQIEGGELVAQDSTYNQKLTMTGGKMTVKGFGEQAEIGDVQNGSITTTGTDAEGASMTVATVTDSVLTSGAGAITAGELTTGNKLDAGTSIAAQAISGSGNTLIAGESIETGAITGGSNSLEASINIITQSISASSNELKALGYINTSAQSIEGSGNTLLAGAMIETGSITGDGNKLTAGEHILSGDVSGAGNELQAAKYLVLGKVEGEGHSFSVVSADQGGARMLRLARSRSAAAVEEGSISTEAISGSNHVFAAEKTLTLESVAGAGHSFSGNDIVVEGSAEGSGHSFVAINSVSISNSDLTDTSISGTDITYTMSVLQGESSITGTTLDFNGSTIVLSEGNFTFDNKELKVDVLAVENAEGSFTLDISNVESTLRGDDGALAFTTIVFVGTTGFHADNVALTLRGESETIQTMYVCENVFSIPEPTTASLTLLALAALAARRRRK